MLARPLAAIAGLAFVGGGAASAQDAADLAQQTANPVADLAVIPFQFNADSGFGTEDADRLSSPWFRSR
jgi:hypothetical protein